MNGTVLTMDNSTVQVNTPLTMDELQVEGDGFTARRTSTDDLRKYTFYNSSASPTNISWDWDGISTTQLDFTRLTAGITANVNVTGTELGDVTIDGDDTVTWSFASLLNSIPLLAGTIIELIFDLVVAPSGGGGGGGGSTSVEITLDTQQHFLIPGISQSTQGEITVTWTSGNDITINSLVLEDTPLQFKFDVPITLIGSGGTVSSGVIPYSIIPPENFCSDTIFANCVEAQLYQNPFEITANVQGATIIKSGEIPVDTRLTAIPDNILLIILFLAILIIAYFIARRKPKAKSRKEVHKSVHKSHKKTGNHRKAIKVQRKTGSLAKQLNKTKR